MDQWEMIKRITQALPLSLHEAGVYLNAAMWDAGLEKKVRFTDEEYLKLFNKVVKSIHPAVLRQMVESDRREKEALRQAVSVSKSQ